MAEAASDYTRGEMEIGEQQSTWDGFMAWLIWGSIFIIISVGYATFTLGIGMPWIPALGICAFVGVAAGLFMGLGGAYYGTLIGFGALAVFIRFVAYLVAIAL